MHAFRCKNCGHLHHAEHAGENELPHACAACGAGVSFGPDRQKLEELIAAHKGGGLAAAIQAAVANPEKNYHPDNWEVLADATPGRLAELGLAPDAVARHAPARITAPAGRVLHAAAGDSALAADSTSKG